MISICLEPFLRFALHPHLFDLGFALCQRLREESGLPIVLAYLFAETLILGIVGAQCIAVGEQGGGAVQVEQGRVVEQRGIAGSAEFLIHQEVAVAVHDVDAGAASIQSPQGIGDAPMKRVVQVVISRPVLEQVAQDIQCFGFGAIPAAKRRNSSVLCG